MFLQCENKAQILNYNRDGETNNCKDPECAACLDAKIEKELGDLDSDVAKTK